jgi:hypothetical protein
MVEVDWMAVLAVLAIVLLGLMLLIDRVARKDVEKLLAAYVDPESFAAMFEAAFRLGLDAGFGVVEETETTVDDEIMKQIAVQAGYVVSGDAETGYTLTKAVSPTV